MIPHGGGAVPYHWGRYQGLAARLERPAPGELLRNVFFDTCVYHQPGIDLLARRAFAPTELPAGVVTGMIGAPYLLWLLARANRIGRGG